jgi:hypothetical protein
MSDDEYAFYRNKRPDKTYVSRQLAPSESPRVFRIASKVFDSTQEHAFAKEAGELVIRVTEGGRQEVVAKFFEDTRDVFVLTIQRFSTDTGKPHKTSFSFVGDEIPRLLTFIENLTAMHFPSAEKINITDAQLKKLLVSPAQARSIVLQNQDLVLELARSAVTKSDIIALGYRRQQLERFEKLLTDPDYFSQQCTETQSTPERLWQSYFQANTWLFGFGLTFVALSALDEARLEQTVVGGDVTGPGKRTDALLRTRGAIESLCFVEIKTHTTPLLQKVPYRPGCWAPSGEVAGGVAQVQGTVELAVRRLTQKLELTSKLGELTGEAVFSFQPRSFLVVGSLEEFTSEHGANTDKFRSFELYRRSTVRPEIVTFDELLERAKFILERAET